MTVHYELPTASDFRALAGEHHPAVTIYASTAPIVSERERAATAVKSAFDEALDRLRADGEDAAAIETLKVERDRVLADKAVWSSLARSLAVFAAPGFNEVYVLPNRLDDAVHVGSHFTLGQLLRAPSQDQEAFAITISSNEWALWHALPTSRAEEMPLDPNLPKNLEEAGNRDLGEPARKKGAGHGDRGTPEQDRRPEIQDNYSKQVADAVWQELNAHDPDGKVPLFVFAAEPLLGSFLDRAHNSRRVVPVQGGPDRLNAAEIDEELRRQLAALNVHEAKAALRGLADGSAGRVERDLAAIGRMAAEGGVETLWFDFTTSVNGTLDLESGAIEFATSNGGGPALADGTRAGDILPQLAMMVLSRGGKVVTVRGDDLADTDWSGPAVAELRFALT
ncbi:MULTISPECIES: baeRF3 domain-containing protein [unclassified Agromyces]|uniref:baeRF3 domain-containing protein n=1 Tax=unclassified Agromyces TaxID=2639701 RepID=UPI003015428F